MSRYPNKYHTLVILLQVLLLFFMYAIGYVKPGYERIASPVSIKSLSPTPFHLISVSLGLHWSMILGMFTAQLPRQCGRRACGDGGVLAAMAIDSPAFHDI
jgi:hypothetical protein